MDDREALTRLRSLVYQGDGPGLVAALTREPWSADSLQLIGDGLVVAVRGGVDGSPEVARRCVDSLGERAWAGDLELVEALEAALGNGPTPMLRPLPVDLEELAMILEGGPVHGGGRIDLTTGEVWPQSEIEYAEETGEIEDDDDDPDRRLWVHCEGSHDGHRDKELFIQDLDDEQLAGRLARDRRPECIPAIQGPAFRTARPDDPVARVLERPAAREGAPLACDRGLHAGLAAALNERKFAITDSAGEIHEGSAARELLANAIIDHEYTAVLRVTTFRSYSTGSKRSRAVLESLTPTGGGGVV